MIIAMIKSAILLAIASGVVSRMKRQSAAVRHAVWTAGLIGAMAVPLCTWTLPAWQTEAASPIFALLDQSLHFFGSFRSVAITVWLAGATVGILLLFYSASRLAWVAIGAEPVEDARWAVIAEDVRRKLGIRRPVRLLQNRSVPFLGTWGIVVPRVLLPRNAEEWPDERIRMVLAHELSHIQRHDWVVQVLADAARAIYWFNPIFWIASSRLRRESEHACDDTVVRLGAVGTRYAEELLAMTRTLRGDQRSQSTILAMAQPSHLEQRMIALLNPSLNRLAAAPWAVLLVSAFAIALTLPLAAVRPDSSQALAPVALVNFTPAPAPVSDTPAHFSEPPKPSKPEKTSTVTKIEKASRLGIDTSSEPTPSTAATAATLSSTDAPAVPTPYECKVTRSVYQMKVSSTEKQALGNGPWIINEDRTIWAADQSYVANQTVNTVWMRPANTELTISGHRLDGDAPQLSVGPAAPYPTGFIGIGVVFPLAGCWEVTATAGDSTLTFVTRVRE